MNDSHATVVTKYFAKITILFLECMQLAKYITTVSSVCLQQGLPLCGLEQLICFCSVILRVPSLHVLVFIFCDYFCATPISISGPIEYPYSSWLGWWCIHRFKGTMLQVHLMLWYMHHHNSIVSNQDKYGHHSNEIINLKCKHVPKHVGVN